MLSLASFIFDCGDLCFLSAPTHIVGMCSLTSLGAPTHMIGMCSLTSLGALTHIVGTVFFYFIFEDTLNFTLHTLKGSQFLQRAGLLGLPSPQHSLKFS